MRRNARVRALVAPALATRFVVSLSLHRRTSGLSAKAGGAASNGALHSARPDKIGVAGLNDFIRASLPPDAIISADMKTSSQIAARVVQSRATRSSSPPPCARATA